ncbi:MAG: PhzF family phenazine biosynthesis protein [Pseudomonadota bacterium]
MKMKDFLWIDAFTETRYGGNPCAVVFEADDLSPEARIAYTRETGLVECAFLQRSAKADFGARYYMPTGEILMAGHPTIATVTALVAAGEIDLSKGRAELTLEVGAGVLEVLVEARQGRPPLITMTQHRPAFGRSYAAADIAKLYGLEAKDLVGEPQTVSTGTPFCIAQLGSLEALRRARLDVKALAALKAAKDADFMEPFLCVTEGATDAGQTFARLLLPPPLPPEDPFTGSATGCMAAYLWRKGAVAQSFTAEQGHDLGRPGRAEVTLLGQPDDITGVKVGGSGVVVMQGQIR